MDKIGSDNFVQHEMDADIENSNSVNAPENKPAIEAELEIASEKKAALDAIEPRLLLDAAGAETADATINEAAALDAENWNSSVSPNSGLQDDIEIMAIEAAQSIFKEIVFVDSKIADPSAILDGISNDVEVYILSDDLDGVEQIASVLKDFQDLDAVHIISHGRSGTLDLGSTKLTESSINGKHADEMEVIRGALSENADLLIYGCDFGAAARGVSAIEALAQATGADVAASEDLTGSTLLGGDWELEVREGEIEAVELDIEDFAGILAAAASDDVETVFVGAPITIDPLNNDNGGDLSITQIIDTADGNAVHALNNAGDTATLASGTVIELRSDGRLKVTAAAVGSESFDYIVADASDTTTDQGTVDLTAGADFATARAIGFVGVVDTYAQAYGGGGQTYLRAEEGNNNYKVIWEDGTVQDYTSNNEHWIYRNFGSRTTSEFVIVGDFSGFDMDHDGNTQAHGRDLIEIKQWGNVAWTNLNGAFAGMTNLEITATDGPDLSNVTNLTKMFHNATNIGGDFSNWDVSNITNMQQMFDNVRTAPSGLENWDVSNVTNMAYMFRNALDFNTDIGGWDVSSVTNMYQMFYNSINADNAFDQDLSAWDVSNVTSFSYMFGSAHYAKNDFNGDLANWDLSSATTVERMFQNNAEFDGDVSGWKIGSVDANGDSTTNTNASYMFYNTRGFDNTSINTWDTRGITNMKGMFYTNTTFKQDLHNWDTSNVTDMSQMFVRADQFNNNITTWDTSKVTNMYQMFHNAAKFNQDINYKENGGFDFAGGQGSVDAWDVSNVENMAQMFYFSMHPNTGVQRHNFNQDLDGWDTSSLKYADHMFRTYYGNRHDFNGNIDNWDMTNVISAQYMFGGNYAINRDIKNWEFGEDANLYRMFYVAVNFNGDLSTWDVSKVANFSNMFESAHKFNTDISRWDTSNAKNMSQMFYNARAFDQDISFKSDQGYDSAGATVDAWDVSNVTNMYRMFRDARTFNQDISNWNVGNVTHMGEMFMQAYKFDSPLDAWGALTGNVTNMAHMFYNTPLFNQDLNNWDTSSVTSFYRMFGAAVKFNGNIENWNTDSATDMRLMFERAYQFNRDLSTKAGVGSHGGDAWDMNGVTSTQQMFDNARVFNQDIGNWDTSTITNMSYMFRNAWAFNQDINTGNDSTLAGGSSWDVSNVTNMAYMFNSAIAFSQDIGASWDTASLNYMIHMFNNADSFNFHINDFDVTKVTNMTGVFANTEIFNQPVTWNMENVTSMNSMFYNAKAFNDPSINDWNVSKVTDMRSMFQSTSAFDQPLTDWSTDALVHMTQMFYGAKVFNQDLDHFDVSKVTDMYRVFRGATLFDGDLSTWDTSKVTRFQEMFYQASNFNQDLTAGADGVWDVSKASNFMNMFGYAYRFNGDVTNWDTSSATRTYAMFQFAYAFNQDISTNAGGGFDGVDAWNVGNVYDMRYMFRNTQVFNQDLENWDTSKAAFMDYMFFSATGFDQNLGDWDLSAWRYQSGWGHGGLGFLTNSGLSWENLDATIRGQAEQWENTTRKHNVYFDALNVEYYDAHWGAVEDLNKSLILRVNQLYRETADASNDGVVYVIEDGSASGNVLENDSDFDAQYKIDADTDAYDDLITGTFDDSQTHNLATYTPETSGTYTFNIEALGLIGTANFQIGTTAGGNDIYRPTIDANDQGLAGELVGGGTTADTITVYLEAGQEYHFSYELATDSEATQFSVAGELHHFEEDLTVTQYYVMGHTSWIAAGDEVTVDGVGTFRIDADGTYEFTPVADFDGDVPTVNYQISDNRDGQAGVATSTDTATLQFAMISVNDAPEGTNANIVIREDTPFSFVSVDGSLFGFTDPSDGNGFYSIIVDTLPPADEGVLTLDGVDVVVGQEILQVDLAKLVFTPAADINNFDNPTGSADTSLGQFTYRVRDDGGLGRVGSTNLLRNAGLHGLTDWERVSGDVSGTGTNGGAITSVSGNGYAQFNYSNWNADGDAIRQTVDTTVGQNYAFDVAMFANNNSTQTHYYTLNVYDDAGNIVEKIDGQIDGFANRTVTLEFTATSDNSTVEIVSRPHPDSNSAGSDFFIDRVGLYAVGENLLANAQFTEGAYDYSEASFYFNEPNATANRVYDSKTFAFTPTISGDYHFGASLGVEAGGAGTLTVTTADGSQTLYTQTDIPNNPHNSYRAPLDTLTLVAGTEYHITFAAADPNNNGSYLQDLHAALHIAEDGPVGSLTSWTALEGATLNSEAQVVLNSGTGDNSGQGVEQTVTGLEIDKVYSLSTHISENGSQNFSHTYLVEVLDSNGDVIKSMTGMTTNNAGENSDISFTAATADITIRITNTTTAENSTNSEMLLGGLSLIEGSENEGPRGDTILGANLVSTDSGDWNLVNVDNSNPWTGVAALDDASGDFYSIVFNGGNAAIVGDYAEQTISVQPGGTHEASVKFVTPQNKAMDYSMEVFDADGKLLASVTSALAANSNITETLEFVSTTDTITLRITNPNNGNANTASADLHVREIAVVPVYNDTDTAANTIDFNILPENDAQAFAPIPDQVGVDGTDMSIFDLSVYLNDLEADDLVYNLDPATTPVWLSISGDGKLSGKPSADASQVSNVTGGSPGVYTITVNTTDTTSDTIQATTTFTLTITNDDVTAVDDNAATTEHAAITGSVIGERVPVEISDSETVTLINSSGNVADHVFDQTFTPEFSGTYLVTFGFESIPSGNGLLIVNNVTDGVETFRPSTDPAERATPGNLSNSFEVTLEAGKTYSFQAHAGGGSTVANPSFSLTEVSLDVNIVNASGIDYDGTQIDPVETVYTGQNLAKTPDPVVTSLATSGAGDGWITTNQNGDAIEHRSNGGFHFNTTHINDSGTVERSLGNFDVPGTYTVSFTINDGDTDANISAGITYNGDYIDDLAQFDGRVVSTEPQTNGITVYTYELTLNNSSIELGDEFGFKFVADRDGPNRVITINDIQLVTDSSELIGYLETGNYGTTPTSSASFPIEPNATGLSLTQSSAWYNNGENWGIEQTEGEYIMHFNSVNTSASGVGFQQLGTIAEAGRYLVSIDVGNFSGSPFANQVSSGLTIGGASATSIGTVLTSVEGANVEPAQGEWQTWTFTLDVPQGSSLIGQDLGYHFTVGSDPSGGSRNAAIDNLRMDFFEDLGVDVNYEDTLSVVNVVGGTSDQTDPANGIGERASINFSDPSDIPDITLDGKTISITSSSSNFGTNPASGGLIGNSNSELSMGGSNANNGSTLTLEFSDPIILVFGDKEGAGSTGAGDGWWFASADSLTITAANGEVYVLDPNNDLDVANGTSDSAEGFTFIPNSGSALSDRAWEIETTAIKSITIDWKDTRSSLSAQAGTIQIEAKAPQVGTPVNGSNGGQFVVESNGNYSFNPGNDFDYLSAGETERTSVTYQISDNQGGFDTATLEITVTGENDGTVSTEVSNGIHAVATAIDSEDASFVEATATVNFTDVDDTDTAYSTSITNVSLSGASHGLGTLAQADLLALIESVDVTKASGENNGSVDVNFSAESSVFDYLHTGETVHLNYTVQIDNDGIQEDVVVRFSVSGTNDGAEFSSAFIAETGGEETQTAGTISASATLAFVDADINDTTHSASVTAVTKAGSISGLSTVTDAQLIAMVEQLDVSKLTGTQLGTVQFGFNGSGNAFNYLTAGETVDLFFTVTLNDDGLTDTSQVKVTITGTNDGPSFQAGVVDVDLVETTNVDSLVTTEILAFDDSDVNDTDFQVSVSLIETEGETDGLALSVAELADLLQVGNIKTTPGSTTGTVDLDFQAGYEDFDYLTAGETVELTYTVELDNNGDTAETTYVIKITGTNDGPTFAVTNGVNAEATANETTNAATIDASAVANLTDVDFNDTNYTTTVKSVSRGAGAPSATDVSDAELLAMLTEITVNKPEGSNTGMVTAEFEGTSAAFDYLSVGDTAELTYTVEVDNAGIKNDVTFRYTVVGTNDAPVISAISGAMTSDSTTGGPVTADITIAFSDLDQGDKLHSLSITGVSTAGTTNGLPGNSDLIALISNFGVSYDTNADGTNTGSFTPTFTAPADVFDYLGDGESVDISYTVVLSDNEGGTDSDEFTILVTGTNDSASISFINAASATETTDTSAVTASLFASFVDLDVNQTNYSAVTESASWSGETAGLSVIGDNAAIETALLGMISNLEASKDTGTTGGAVTAEFSSDSTVFDYLAPGETVDILYTVVLTDNGVEQDLVYRVTVEGTNDAPVVSAVVNGTATETSDVRDLDGLVTIPQQNITSSASVEFGDVDLNDVGHTASVIVVERSGENDGLTGVSDVDLLALIGNLAVTKNAGENSGSVAPSFTAPPEMFDYLAKGQTTTLTYTLELKDGDGGVVNQDFAITITGANDLAEITANGTASAAEPTSFVEIEALARATFSDVDLDDTNYNSELVSATLSGATAGLEALTQAELLAMIDSIDVRKDAGSDNGLIDAAFKALPDDFDYLASDDTVTITYVLELENEGGKVLVEFSFSITGTNDAPTINSVNNITATETTNSDNITGATNLTFTDIDLNDVGHTASITNVSTSGEDDGLASVTNDTLKGLIDNLAVTKNAGEDNGSVAPNFTASSSMFDYLNTGQTVTLTYTIGIDDGDGGLDSADFTVTITGTNDGPVITSNGTGAGTETTDTSDITATATASFSDVDLDDITYTTSVKSVSLSGETEGLERAHDLSGLTGLTNSDLLSMISVSAVDKSIDSNSGDIEAAFTAASTAFDYLAKDETVTLTYTVELDDDGIKRDVTFAYTITGTNDAPTIDSVNNITATETTNSDNITGATNLTFTDIDLNDVGHTASITNVSTSGEDDGLASVTNDTLKGLIDNLAVTKNAGEDNGSVAPNFTASSSMFDYLNTGQTVTLTYTIGIDDGDGGLDSADFTVTITGTNDGPVITSNGTGAGTETTDTSDITATATASFSDVDLDDITYTTSVKSVSLSGETEGLERAHDLSGLTGLTNSDLLSMISVSAVDKSIDSNSGDIEAAFTAASTAFDYLAKDETVTLTYTVELDDDGIKRDVTFAYTITGTNDAPIIDAIAATDTLETTDSSNIVENINVEFTDLDLNDTQYRSKITDAITTGETGGLDAAVDLKTLIRDDVHLQFLDADKDAGASRGAMELVFDAQSGVFDYLHAGESVTITYSVEIADIEPGPDVIIGGFTLSTTQDKSVATQNFTVTITGTNDGPVVTSTGTSSVAETTDSSDIVTSATATFTDVDRNDVSYETTLKSVSLSGLTIGLEDQFGLSGLTDLTEAGLLGLVETIEVTKLAGSNDGTVVADFRAGSTVFDYIDKDSSVTLTYTVELNDNGIARDVVFAITVTGTNDAPSRIGEFSEIFTEGAAITPVSLNPFFTDVDNGDTFTYQIDPQDLPEGMVFDNATGILSGTPANDLSVTGNNGGPVHTVNVTAIDEHGAEAQLSIDLEFFNPPPEITGAVGPFTMFVGNSESEHTAAVFTDPDGDDLTYTVDALPLGLEIDPNTGRIFGTPDLMSIPESPDGAGNYTVELTVTDAQGRTAISTFDILIVDPTFVLQPEQDPGMPELDFTIPELEAEDPFILSAIKGFNYLDGITGESDNLSFPKGEQFEVLIDAADGETVLRVIKENGQIFIFIEKKDGSLSVWSVEGAPYIEPLDENESSDEPSTEEKKQLDLEWITLEKGQVFLANELADLRNAKIRLVNNLTSERIVIDLSGKIELSEFVSVDDLQLQLIASAN